MREGAVCHVLPYLSADYGGPVLAAAGMARGLAIQGWQVQVAGLVQGDERPASLFAAERTHAFADSRLGSWRHSARLRDYLDAVDVQVFHSHGLWTDVHRTVAAVARARGIPHVVGPCGMLNPGALRRSRWKKRVVWYGCQRAALRDSACLVGNSPNEVDDILRQGLRTPVALVPNPILPEDAGTVARSTSSGTVRRCAVLYLGRLHPVKGAMRLLDAWGQLTPECRSGWELVLAGPDEGGYRAQLEARVAALGCGSSVLFTGALGQQEKWAALRQAEFLVLPSDFENFGMAAAEAMLAGLPVVATTGTPWRSLPENGAGWWVSPTAEALAAALAEAMALPRAERLAMGERGRRLAQEFTPESVGARLALLYSWVLGRGERPAWVFPSIPPA